MNLIIAAEKIENISNPNSIQETVTLGIIEEWIDEESTTLIYYIEKFKGERKKTNHQQTNKLSNKLLSIGCVVAILIFGIAFFVGLAEIID